MDCLVALGTTAAWLYGVVLISKGFSNEQIYNATYEMQVRALVGNFEVSSVLLTIILFGKYLESFSKKKTVDKLS